MEIWQTLGFGKRWNRVHERALEVAYKDYETDFCSLLKNDGSEIKHFKKLLVTTCPSV